MQETAFPTTVLYKDPYLPFVECSEISLAPQGNWNAMGGGTALYEEKKKSEKIIKGHK